MASHINNHINKNGAACGRRAWLEFRLEHEARELEPIAQKLAALCDYVLENYHPVWSYA